MCVFLSVIMLIIIISVRVICSRAYHALFMYNMLIRPKSREELATWGHPDFVIYNAGAFPANKYTKDVTSTTSIAINLKERQMVILGTQYAGEMKKGVFSVMHYFLPKAGVLSLHSSANEVCVLFCVCARSSVPQQLIFFFLPPVSL